MQLAGHLRGRALQEWDLLEDHEKNNSESALKTLRSRLDSGNKILAAQDFRRTAQRETESVPDFIRRLERAFRIAYGRDCLTQETKEAFLYGQLQDGLRTDLMRNPSVSGALAYKELCMATRNEEKRRAEMKKREQYRSSGFGSGSWRAPNSKKRAGDGRDDHSVSGMHSSGLDTGRESRSSGEGTTSLSFPKTFQEQKVCYGCGKPGHFRRDCRSPKSESKGLRQDKAVARQVTIPEEDHNDPLTYLYSSMSEEEDDVKLVRVQDRGSQLRCAQVQVQGVRAWGIVDSGADITIMGKELFKKVASVCRLKKRDFKRPDKIPKTYDRQPFSLDGRLELEITFGEKTMITTMYVKMNAHDELLLSEGVCRQLGITRYHPNVRLWEKRHQRASKEQSKESGGEVRLGDGAIVPMVRVKLVQRVRVLPLHATQVQVKVEGDRGSQDRLLVVEPDDQRSPDGIVLQPGLLCVREGIASVQLINQTGFTHHLAEGEELGTVTEATIVSFGECERGHSDITLLHSPTNTDDEDLLVKKVSTAPVAWRREKLMEIFGDSVSLPEPKRTIFCEMLMDHHKAFSLEADERGETDLIQLEIDTGGAPPKRQRPRRMPFSVREEVSRQVKKMQEAGVIQPSNSPWASPIVLVRKKDGTHRFCIDYRELNAVTRQDTFPLPRVDDLLDQLGDTRFFSTLDLAAGYWQIKIHPDSREKTAFVTHQGLHEFSVMPFGLTNAPAVFQRLMQKVLMQLNPENGPDFVVVYIDDVLVFSKTLEDHLKHLTLVLDRLIEVGLKLNPTKCYFIRQEVAFLGHIITPQGLRTTNRHITAVAEFPMPQSVREVRQFLGLASYYRRFVKSFAELAQPLHSLTRKGAMFTWSDDSQKSFDGLKQALTRSPRLVYPSFNREFYLETDASILGLGAVLSQVQDDGKKHPIAYASRALSQCEKNYAITELETLAVVWAVSHFRSYLYGQRVTIYTDHAAVGAVLQSPSASGKHARWWAKLHGGGMKEVIVKYRAGKENCNADALSRCPQGEAPTEMDEEVQVAVVTGMEDKTTDVSELLRLPPSDSQAPDPVFLAAEQRKDPQLLEMITYLERDELPAEDKHARKLTSHAHLFTLENQILYFMDTKHHHRKRAAVPAQLREGVVANAHSGPYAGHFSTNRLYNALIRTWWWEGMYSYVDRYCKSCPQCATVSGAGRPGRPPLQPIPVKRPFQIFGVDVMGLPKTESGNKHVLVFQDFLTKWPLVFPIPDQKTTRIARILVEEIVPVFGVPEALLSDRGTNLLSFLMKEVCSLLGIEKINTTAYHPQCNGLTERFNRTLKTMLRKHAAKFGLQWDKYLHGVLWAYRNTPHDSTLEKPSFLLYGMDCRYPTEAALMPPSPIEPTDVSDYREELILALSSARQLAAEAIQRAQVKYKRNYDRSSRVSTLKIGDWILIRFPQEESGALRKLSRPWHGPYRINDLDDTGVTAAKVYFPQDGTIRVHQSRVTSCPEAFPAGYFWYGNRRRRPGRPPRWLEALQSGVERSGDTPTADTGTASDQSDKPEREQEETQAKPGPEQSEPLLPVAAQCNEPPQVRDTPTSTRRTRTRKIAPPDRLMFCYTLGTSF